MTGGRKFDVKGDNADKLKQAMQRQALKKLVDLELLYQEAQAKNLVADDKKVDEMITDIKTKFPDAGAFEEILTKNGSSEAELREDIRTNLSIENIMYKEISSKVEISDKDAKDFYQKNKEKFNLPEAVRVSHILTRDIKEKSGEAKESAKQEESAEQKIKDIKKRLDKGEDFTELARANSACPSGKKGGDLGYIEHGKTVPEFEKAAFALKKIGDISPIVKTSFGYHIIKLADKRPAGIVPYDEIKEELKGNLKKQKINEKSDEYIKKLHEKAKIESEIELATK